LLASRLVALLTTVFLLLACAAGARGEVVAKGNLFLSFSGEISPDALPRQTLAPISVSFSGTVRTFSGERPPSMRRIEIAINRGGQLDVRGLPVCNRAQIQPSSTAQARAICGPALVGEGTFAADVAFPEQTAFPSSGHVLAFNAVVGATRPSWPAASSSFISAGVRAPMAPSSLLQCRNPGATFPFARATIGFSDGRTLTSTLTRGCRVRR
jgi:hypothetical protein